MLQEAISSDSSDNDDDYLNEDEIEDQAFFCLFCEMVLNSRDTLFDHINNKHSINLGSVFSKLSFYGIIKAINYTRSTKCGVNEFCRVVAKADTLGDEYLIPNLSDDALLMIDFEEIALNESSSSNGTGTEAEGRMKFLEAKLKQIQQAYLELLEKSKQPNSQPQPATDRYFESYADYSIHAEMLQDKVRTEAYRDYIYKNKELFSGKDVLDVGCGTGILSMFCAKGGANSVVAVDNSQIVDKAKNIIKCNNMSSKIEVVEGKVEELELHKKFDVLISEWMGYALLFECMLDSVIEARDKYLKPGGLVVPNRASMFLSAVGDVNRYQKRFHFWKNVYEFDMSVVIPDLYSEAVVETVAPKHVISEPCGFKHLDLSVVKASELEFSRPFQLQITKSTTLTAIVIHFTCFFDGNVSITLDTSPENESTHWLQTVLYLKSMVSVLAGDIVQGFVGFNKNSTVKRGYIIKLEGTISRDSTDIGKFNQEYYLN